MWRESRFFFLAIMALMGSVSLLATDISLPAFPEMSSHFNCSQSQIQTSFSLFLLGLAGSQLVYGMLADYLGRKNVALTGLIVFTLASLWCAFSSTLTEFLFARLLQAIGGGVGSVINRSMVASRYNRTESVKIFSTIFPIIGLSAAIGPFLGGYLTSFFGWRSTFYFMVGFGLLTCLLIVFFLKETRRERQEETQQIKALLHSPLEKLSSYLVVLRNLNFLGYAMVLGSSFAAFRCYAAESPFVFHNQGYLVEERGTFYISLSVGYILGNLCAKKLVNTLSVEKVLNIGFLFLTLGGGSMVIGTLFYAEMPQAIILPMALITFGNGFLFPTSSAGAMSSVPTAFSGMASGLMGSLQFLTAALCINWVGEVCQGEALWMSLFISVIILMGLASYRLLALAPKPQSLISG